MRNMLFLSAALATLAGIPAADAQIIVQPTIIEPAPAYVAPVYAPPPVIVDPYYPYYHEHHHHYNWRYWHYRGEHRR